MRTILAEGRASVRQGLRQIIENHCPQCEVFEAASLTETLRTMVERHPVRLAVIDLGLPGVNGFHGLATVRRLFPETRCVLLSASDDHAVVGEAMRQGAHAVVPMNLTAAALPKALACVIAGERYLPPGPASLPARSAAIQAKLTPRERDIMRLLGEGLPNKVIANRLSVSEVTVKSHLGNVFRKLGVQNRLQALRMMVEAEHSR